MDQATARPWREHRHWRCRPTPVAKPRLDRSQAVGCCCGYSTGSCNGGCYGYEEAFRPAALSKGTIATAASGSTSQFPISTLRASLKCAIFIRSRRCRGWCPMNRIIGWSLRVAAMAILGSEAAIAADIFIMCKVEHSSHSSSKASTLPAARALSQDMKKNPTEIRPVRYFKLNSQLGTWKEFNRGTRMYDFDKCGLRTECKITNTYFRSRESGFTSEGTYFEYSIDRITGTFHDVYYIESKPILHEAKEVDHWVVIRVQHEGRCEPSEDMEKRAIETRKF